MNAVRKVFFDQAPPQEHNVEARIARLESDVEHIKLDLQSMHVELKAANDSIATMRADVSAIKATLPHLATKDELRCVEGSLTAKINSVEGTLESSIHALEARLIRWIVGSSLASLGLAFTIARFVG